MKKMQYKIELSNEAESDFDSSYEYYAKDSEKVADKLYRQVNTSLKTIAENPQGFQKVFKDVRKYVMKKFPFVIYYRIESVVIQVIAIFHTSRNPIIWEKRVEKKDK